MANQYYSILCNWWFDGWMNEWELIEEPTLSSKRAACSWGNLFNIRSSSNADLRPSQHGVGGSLIFTNMLSPKYGFDNLLLPEKKIEGLYSIYLNRNQSHAIPSTNPWFNVTYLNQVRIWNIHYFCLLCFFSEMLKEIGYKLWFPKFT